MRQCSWNPEFRLQAHDFGVSGSQFGFNITNSADLPVVIESCDDLAAPVWTPLRTVTLTNGLFSFSEPVQSNAPARFYGLSFPQGGSTPRFTIGPLFSYGRIMQVDWGARASAPAAFGVSPKATEPWFGSLDSESF